MDARQRLNRLPAMALAVMCPGVIFGLVTKQPDIVQVSVLIFAGWACVAMLLTYRRLAKGCAAAGRTQAEIGRRVAYHKYRATGVNPDLRRRVAIARRRIYLGLTAAAVVAGLVAVWYFVTVTSGAELSTNPAFVGAVAAFLVAVLLVVQTATQTKRVRWAEDELAGRKAS